MQSEPTLDVYPNPIGACNHDEHEHGFYVQDAIGYFFCEGCGITTGSMPLVLQERLNDE